MKTKKDIIAETVGLEGDYSNHPDDPGGKTRFGITERVARAYGYEGDMHDLPKELAIEIYDHLYWRPLKGDSVLELSENIAAELFDTSVNCGLVTAIKFLQRSLNVLNRKGELYPDIRVDGNIGPITIFTLSKYLRIRDEQELYKALNCLQGARYIKLCEKREARESSLYGWIKNRVRL